MGQVLHLELVTKMRRRVLSLLNEFKADMGHGRLLSNQILTLDKDLPSLLDRQEVAYLCRLQTLHANCLKLDVS